MNNDRMQMILYINWSERIREIENIQIDRLEKLSRIFSIPKHLRNGKTISQIKIASTIEDCPIISKEIERIKEIYISDYEFFSTYLLSWKPHIKLKNKYSDVIDNLALNIIALVKCSNDYYKTNHDHLLSKFLIYIEHYFAYSEISFLNLYQTHDSLYHKIIKHDLDMNIIDWIFILEKLNIDDVLETVLLKMDELKLRVESTSKYSLIKKGKSDEYIVDIDDDFDDQKTQLIKILRYFWKELYQDFKLTELEKAVKETKSKKEEFEELIEKGVRKNIKPELLTKPDNDTKKKKRRKTKYDNKGMWDQLLFNTAGGSPTAKINNLDYKSFHINHQVIGNHLKEMKPYLKKYLNLRDKDIYDTLEEWMDLFNYFGENKRLFDATWSEYQKSRSKP